MQRETAEEDGSRNRLFRVRVRGIYATALSKLLLDREDFQLVDVSPVLQKRLGIPANSELPADVTVKTVEDCQDRLLVVGFPDAVDSVLSVLEEGLKDLITHRSELNLYSSLVPYEVTSADEGCVVKVRGGEKALLARGFECRGYPVVSVVKAKLFPGELPVVAPGLRLVGKYLIISAGAPPRVTFSEHIRDRDRRLLLTSLSLKYKDRGLGIHWRSSSSAAPLEELGRELQELAAKAEALYNEVSAGKFPKGEIVTEGEGIALVDLPLTAKVELDRLRSAVVPTALYHHALKSGEELLSSLVDFAERVMEGAGVSHEEMGELLLDFVVSKLAESHSVTVYHVKPDGEVVRMRAAGPPTIHRLPGGRFRIVLTRRIAGKGTYDGLGVPKEEGDYAETVIELGRWHVIHRYYSRDGVLKGTYININTPPEVTLTGIKYYDLYVDVVQVPGERRRVVDEDKLEEACKEGVLSKSLCERAREEARRLVEGDA